MQYRSVTDTHTHTHTHTDTMTAYTMLALSHGKNALHELQEAQFVYLCITQDIIMTICCIIYLVRSQFTILVHVIWIMSFVSSIIMKSGPACSFGYCCVLHTAVAQSYWSVPLLDMILWRFVTLEFFRQIYKLTIYTLRLLIFIFQFRIACLDRIVICSGITRSVVVAAGKGCKTVPPKYFTTKNHTSEINTVC